MNGYSGFEFLAIIFGPLIIFGAIRNWEFYNTEEYAEERKKYQTYFSYSLMHNKIMTIPQLLLYIPWLILWFLLL